MDTRFGHAHTCTCAHTSAYAGARARTDASPCLHAFSAWSAMSGIGSQARSSADWNTTPTGLALQAGVGVSSAHACFVREGVMCVCTRNARVRECPALGAVQAQPCASRQTPRGAQAPVGRTARAQRALKVAVAVSGARPARWAPQACCGNCTW
jgi:hypothetical protein